MESIADEDPPAPSPPTKRMTNQLQYMKKTVYPALMRHRFSWPFREPVDPVKLELPVKLVMFGLSEFVTPTSDNLYAVL